VTGGDPHNIGQLPSPGTRAGVLVCARATAALHQAQVLRCRSRRSNSEPSMRSTDRDQTVASTQSLMLPTAGLKNMALTPLPPPSRGTASGPDQSTLGCRRKAAGDNSIPSLRRQTYNCTGNRTRRFWKTGSGKRKQTGRSRYAPGIEIPGYVRAPSGRGSCGRCPRDRRRPSGERGGSVPVTFPLVD